MQQFSLCFGKVKKDCLKFIKSQETKADKFKNKERMIKSFLIPLCFWISKKADKKRPYFVGLAGGQGTGKTTISSLIKIILTKYFKLKVFRISIDDFYKTRKERINLSNKIHPMLLTRGVPGTHDIEIMLDFFKKSKSKKFKKYNTKNKPEKGSRVARKDRRMMQTEWREESVEIVEKIKRHAKKRKATVIDIAIGWLLNNSAVTSLVAGPRTMEQWEAYVKALEYKFLPEDEALIEKFVPSGHPSSPGYNDPAYPIEGRYRIS